jgi:hypothetical protein
MMVDDLLKKDLAPFLNLPVPEVNRIETVHCATADPSVVFDTSCGNRGTVPSSLCQTQTLERMF